MSCKKGGERDRHRGEGNCEVSRGESTEVHTQVKGHLGCWQQQMFGELVKDPSLGAFRDGWPRLLLDLIWTSETMGDPFLSLMSQRPWESEHSTPLF